MNTIFDFFVNFLELDFLPYFLAFLSLFIIFRYLLLILNELFDFSLVDYFYDSFYEFKLLLYDFFSICRKKFKK